MHTCPPGLTFCLTHSALRVTLYTLPTYYIPDTCAAHSLNAMSVIRGQLAIAMAQLGEAQCAAAKEQAAYAKPVAGDEKKPSQKRLPSRSGGDQDEEARPAKHRHIKSQGASPLAGLSFQAAITAFCLVCLTRIPHNFRKYRATILPFGKPAFYR